MSVYPLLVIHGNQEKTTMEIAISGEGTPTQIRNTLATQVLKQKPPFTCCVCALRGNEHPNVATEAFTDTIARDKLVVAVTCHNRKCMAINKDMHRQTQYAGPNGLCCICGAKTSKHCAKCKHVFYCSDVCQKKDWETHKFACGRNFLKTEEKNSDGPTSSGEKQNAETEIPEQN